MSDSEKNSRKKGKILLVLFLAAVAAVLILLFGFRVRKLQIIGNEFCSDESMDNSLLAVLQNGKKTGTPAMVDSIRVSISLPWKLKVTVKEKEMAGYFLQNNEKFYFDSEGYVLSRTKEVYDGVIRVNGFDNRTVAEGEQILPDNPEVFAGIAEIAAALKEQKLSISQMDLTEDGVTLVSGKIRVKVGDDNYTERVAQLPEILRMLGNETGTLHVENYTSDSKTIWFEDAKNEKKSMKSID